jgi:hypothetical protein
VFHLTKASKEEYPNYFNLESAPVLLRDRSLRAGTSEDIMIANSSKAEADIFCPGHPGTERHNARLPTISQIAINQIDRAEVDDNSCGYGRTEFANPGEEEFARNLEAHHVVWRYKARTFAVEWDEEGNFVDSFTPDFYLPEYDQYVELDTADRSLTEQNRCVRLLRRHQPAINIKLVNVSDYDEVIDEFAARDLWQ